MSILAQTRRAWPEFQCDYDRSLDRVYLIGVCERAVEAVKVRGEKFPAPISLPATIPDE